VKRQKKQFLWIIVLLILLLGVLFARPILRSIGDYLIINDQLQRADLITSVSGPEYRAIYAAELCQKNLAPRLFYTGGFNAFDNRNDADWSEYLATTYGVPPEEITVDSTTVISTYEEARLVKKFVDAHPDEIKTIIVVTDPYHTRRARWAYQKVLGDQVTILMAPVPFEETGYSASWWKNAASRQMVFQEYFKYGFYLLRYQWASGPLQDLLAKFDRF
jgi:uncharacterized SAM-binding protein YcdF (DUF218 family)